MTYGQELGAYREQMRREEGEIRRLVNGLSPALREEWSALKESYEYFDGETEIELSYLRNFIEEHEAI